MTSLTRRTMLAGAAAATAAAVAPSLATSPTRAAAPLAGKQTAGWYRYRLGSYEVTVATDGVNRFPLPDNFVVNSNKDAVNGALAAAYMEQNMLSIPYSPIAVNTGEKLVVIDTGTGEANFERSKGAAGQFHRNLAASGIDRNSVDIVIISHFHPDHVNGLLMVDNTPGFPNAEIMVPAVEWKYWMDDGEMSRAPQGRMADLFKNNRRVFDALARKVTPYEWNKELAPGISAVATPGHSPGHTSYVVASGSSRVYVQSDVTNIPALFAANPGWHAVFDQDAKMAEETRRKVYEMAVAEKMLVQGFHYPFPALGNIERAGSGYRVVPVAWNPVL
jgi:glyoxylase-like metal-dependent hydrolase (beta-lactamase superfamily II)